QGIQTLFYDRDDVLYVSIHGDPTNVYPAVTGYETERGAGRGEGFTVNLPMPHGSPEAVFVAQLERARSRVVRFAPDVLVVALGFDV
ncbi:histone deacetylase family protein, partial [Burkholderia pseudomallei]